MRRSLAIVKATALEMLSEPLSLLLLLAALVIAVFAPAFHYHQFGEATRMARDAGFSALLICGGAVAAFGTIRTFRREIESRTCEMALTHPVSRSSFFLMKAIGVFAACLVFAAIVFCVSVTIVEGAAVGGEIAKATGGLARLWGPCFAAGVGVVVLPLVVGAALNRFAGCRFVLSFFAVSAALALAAGLWTACRDGQLVFRMLPVALLIVFLTLVLLLAAAAFAVRLKANAAAAFVGVAVALLTPAIGNYYMSDALAGGGSVGWTYVGLAAAATLPLALIFLFLGLNFANGRDMT